MSKDTSISIRMDSQLKEQTESILEQFGLNMTVVVNMLFRQIVREQAIPLSLSLIPRVSAIDELNYSKAHRQMGYVGRTADSVVEDMEGIVAEAERTYGRGRYALVDIKEYEETQATLKLMTELAKGEKSGCEQGWLSIEDVELSLGV